MGGYMFAHIPVFLSQPDTPFSIRRAIFGRYTLLFVLARVAWGQDVLGNSLHGLMSVPQADGCAFAH